MRTEGRRGFLRFGSVVLAATIALSAALVAQDQTTETKKATNDEPESVWRLQAQSVADQLGLSKDQVTILTKAYLAAQVAHRQSLKDLPEEQDKDKSRAALLRSIAKDQATFLSALNGSLSAEAVAKVTMTLGSFNGRWDGYTAELLALKLDHEKLKTAMGLLIKYVSEYEEASKESLKLFNRRPNSRSFKQKLDTDLAGLLTAEQRVQWNKATAMGGGEKK